MSMTISSFGTMEEAKQFIDEEYLEYYNGNVRIKTKITDEGTVFYRVIISESAYKKYMDDKWNLRRAIGNIYD